MDYSEVYSPPRVRKLAGDIALQAGRALDFATLDEESNPLDFNLPSERARAMKLLQAVHSRMIVTCPKCVAVW